eukprot:gene9630-10618_t
MPVGYKCSTNANCASGWCDGSPTWGCRGTCRAKISDGNPCRNGDGNSCSSGQCTCGYCGRRQNTWRRCSTNDNCKSGWCDGRPTYGCRGTCKSKVRDGGRCINGDGNSCSSGQCTCGYCGRKLGNYRRCSTNDNCASGWCNGRNTIGCGGTCQRKRRDYESCLTTLGTGTGDNDHCESGRCEKVSRVTAICSPKNGFRAGSRCNEDTDCDVTKSLWCKGGSLLSSGICTQCPAKCKDGCNAIFDNMSNMKCGRMTTFDHALNELKKVAKPLVDFIECMLPFPLRGCALEAGVSAASCLNPSTPCKIKLGGKTSSCLAINNAGLSFNYHAGPISLSGSVNPTGGFIVDADISGGKVNLEMYGKVSVKARASIKTTGRKTVRLVDKKLYLTDNTRSCRYPTRGRTACQPKMLYRKVLMVGFMPVIVEVKAQAVVHYSLTLETQGAFEAEISYNNEHVIKINKAKATFDPSKGVDFDVGFGSNFNKQVTKKLVVNANVKLVAVFSIGPEITVSVNGMPMRMFTAMRLVAEGELGLRSSYPSRPCLTGSLKAGIGLDAGIEVDLSIPDPGELAAMACHGAIKMACKYGPLKAASCLGKALTGKSLCDEMGGLCDDLKKEISKITPEFLGRTFSGTAIKLRPSFALFSPTGKAFCPHGQRQIASKSMNIGNGRLRGGGGGKPIKTCGAPGVSKSC